MGWRLIPSSRGTKDNSIKGRALGEVARRRKESETKSLPRTGKGVQYRRKKEGSEKICRGRLEASVWYEGKGVLVRYGVAESQSGVEIGVIRGILEH